MAQILDGTDCCWHRLLVSRSFSVERVMSHFQRLPKSPYRKGVAYRMGSLSRGVPDLHCKRNS